MKKLYLGKQYSHVAVKLQNVLHIFTDFPYNRVPFWSSTRSCYSLFHMLEKMHLNCISKSFISVSY